VDGERRKRLKENGMTSNRNDGRKSQEGKQNSNFSFFTCVAMRKERDINLPVLTIKMHE